MSGGARRGPALTVAVGRCRNCTGWDPACGGRRGGAGPAPAQRSGVNPGAAAASRRGCRRWRERGQMCCPRGGFLSLFKRHARAGRYHWESNVRLLVCLACLYPCPPVQ